MANNDQLAQILAAQAAKSARSGKSLYSNPVANYVAGLKTGGANPMADALASKAAAQAAPVRRAAKAQPKIDPAQAIQDKLLARIRTVEETGFGVPGDGMIPGTALRPEVQALFKDAGGISAFDMRNLSPEEQQGLRSLLDPGWVQRQNNPGAGLSEEEKAQALASLRQ